MIHTLDNCPLKFAIYQKTFNIYHTFYQHGRIQPCETHHVSGSKTAVIKVTGNMYCEIHITFSETSIHTDFLTPRFCFLDHKHIDKSDHMNGMKSSAKEIIENVYQYIDELMQGCINSLWPSDAIWRQGSRSTSVQIMACCLTAPSHYPNQCWLIITKVQWC